MLNFRNSFHNHDKTKMAGVGKEYLRVKVGDEELFFQVKQKTTMGRLMSIYSEKVSVIIKFCNTYLLFIG